MLIWTETGWKLMTIGMFKQPLINPEPPKVLKQLERDWVIARNNWIKNFNTAIAASRDYLINGVIVPGPMKDLDPLVEINLPEWAKG